MREFENFIINIPSEVIETRLGRPIRIAILDDGVDVFSDELEGKIKDGQSFCHTSRRDFGESNYFVSAGGHGTAMAVLVCRVFRSVELFVVKLHGAETGQPTAESAAQGVRWAVSKGVYVSPPPSWLVCVVGWEGPEGEIGCVHMLIVLSF